MPQVVTGSRLTDGVVVFLGSASAWVETLAEAARLEGKDAVAGALDEGRRAEADNLVVDVYAIDVAERNGRLVPTKLREAIRAQGPSIHPEFGKPIAPVPPIPPEDDHVSV